MLKQFVERESKFELLAGLNNDFEQICAPLLSKESITSLNEIFPLMQAKEERMIMLAAQISETSVMTTIEP